MSDARFGSELYLYCSQGKVLIILNIFFINILCNLLIGPDEPVFQIQNSKLKGQVESLRGLVYRLNLELSQYQAAYRTPTKDDVANMIFPENKSVPPWLVSSDVFASKTEFTQISCAKLRRINVRHIIPVI